MLWDIWYAFKDLCFALLVFFQEIFRFCRKNFSLRHVFCLQGALKIIFLYSISIFYIICYDVRISNKWDLNTPTVAVYTSDRIGEKLLSQRIALAAKTNGWRVIQICFSEDLTDYFLTSHFYSVAASLVNLIYKPKFNLAVTHYIYVLPYGYNVVYINVPNEMLFTLEGKFRKQYKHLESYDAYIDLYSVANSENHMLTKELARLEKSDSPVISLYLTENFVEYSPAKRDEVLIIGSLWGCLRGAASTKLALQKLADDNILVAYGIEDQFKFLGKAYKGNVEDYGDEIGSTSNIKTLLALQKKYGIALALHSLVHMVDQMPTNRISEAMMAGSIVISDQNGFVKKFFGDNVLYIDTVAQPQEIYSQIKNHVEWIRKNPEEAESKAKAAYDILLKEFALEDSLGKLMDRVEADRAKL